MVQELTNQGKTAKSYDREAWKKGYESQRQESAYWLEESEIEGQIPPELEGTLFRNGPGLLDIGGTPIRHPFDGDGMICGISFQEGRAFVRNRFVRTEAFVEEQEAGKILYRGVFGTQKPGGWLQNIFDFRTKNIANTNVIYWGGKLLALWEAASPYRLDPKTLETHGLDDLNGILEPGEAFAAHPWVDPNCEMDGGEPCLVNFALKPGLSTTLRIYEIAPNGELRRKHDHSVPGFAFIHDFAITPNYCLFFQNPVQFNPIPFALGLKGAAECIKFQPEQPTRAIIIPRKPPFTGVKTIEMPSGFVFHHGNAFEIEDGRVCVDSIAYADFPAVDDDISYKDVDFDALAPGQLWRFTFDLNQNTAESQLIEPRCCEFPTLHPDRVGRDYRYLFMGAAHNETGNAPLQGILKFDHETQERQFWTAAPEGYVSEPIFVPKSQGESEDAGWLLTLVYNSQHHRSDLVILDGEDLNRGAIARLHLRYHIPYGLHGSWTDKAFV